MKRLLLGALLLLSTFLFSQETEFKFTKNGFTDYVVINLDSTKTQSELYKKTLDWVQITYNNPKEVLKGQIENDYIRIEGISKDALCTKSLGLTFCNSVRYQIEISFKNSKYKFDVIKIEQYVNSSQYTSGGWYEIPITDTKYVYKENGELRSTFKQYPDSLQNIFNSLNISLKEFLINKPKTTIESKEW